MGQYFRAANLDKREVVCPWCLGGGAKLWEWAANPYGSVLVLLLRQSSAAGGGDYYGDRTQELTVDPERPEEFLAAITAAADREGRPVQEPSESIVGSWAGDRITLVGDYDCSGLWETSRDFRNVTEELVAAWNDFIELPDFRLEYNPTCPCRCNDG